jgi:DNA-directed RNA polymerase I, II, and III subunit RPABC2
MKETMPKGAVRDQVKSKEAVSVKIGPRKLTRFERARVVGARALQISMGAPVLVDASRELRSPIDIALMELEENVLPMSIRRSLPDGASQNIPLRALSQTD